MDGKTKLKSVPAVNIQQNDKGFTVEVAAPGMTKEDCDVSGRTRIIIGLSLFIEEIRK